MKFIVLSMLIVLSITHAIADTNSGPNDSINVSSTVDIIGPGGVTASCVGIALFDMEQNRRGVAGGSSDIYNINGNQKNRKQRFVGTENFFKVKVLNWTPEIVEFLKSAVDKCVAEKHSFILNNLFTSNSSNRISMKLSPSSAKQLFDDIYAISVTTKQFYVPQKHNQEIDQSETMTAMDLKKECFNYSKICMLTINQVYDWMEVNEDKVGHLCDPVKEGRSNATSGRSSADSINGFFVGYTGHDWFSKVSAKDALIYTLQAYFQCNRTGVVIEPGQPGFPSPPPTY